MRTFFIERWNTLYPNDKWDSTEKSGEFLFSKLPKRVQRNGRKKRELESLRAGNEKQWDITTLAFCLVNAELNLVDDQESGIKDSIETLRSLRNSCYGHAVRASHENNAYLDYRSTIKFHLKNLCGETAVNEIEEIESSNIEIGRKNKMRQLYHGSNTKLSTYMQILMKTFVLSMSIFCMFLLLFAEDLLCCLFQPNNVAVS